MQIADLPYYIGGKIKDRESCLFRALQVIKSYDVDIRTFARFSL